MTLSHVLEGCSVLAGLAAAVLWFVAAKVAYQPYKGTVESGDAHVAAEQRNAALLDFNIRSGKWNARAAVVTAMSVALQAVASAI
jgi:hypothetical protein